MKTLASVALVLMTAGACARPLHYGERDPHHYPGGTGVLTERNHSRCRIVEVYGQRHRVCSRGNTPTGTVNDTVPAAPTDTGSVGRGG